jgi:lipopolysaccharide transport system ATP-binding protein
LLELGIGFHPDFTGRQNAYMAGQLLGLGADEIVALMPEIEAFAEIGGYIDQAVRAYSSGMQMRLAFSVATAHRPDVLIVDEALSVGDAYFQHKCTERIRAFQAAGTTLLFVSHSAAAIKSLCNRAIMLAAGSVARDGSPDEVIDHYNALIVQRTNNYHVNIQKGLDGRAVTRSGTGGAIVQSIDIFVNGTSSRVMKSSVPVDIILTAANVQAVESLCAGILIRDRWGYDVWGTNTFHHGIEMDSPTPGELTSFKFHLPNLYLAPGSYSISAALHAGRDHLSTNFDWCDRMLTFEVVQGAGPMCAGLCNLPVDVTATSV